MAAVMPLTGSGVFHPRWSEHHRPTASSTHSAACIITRVTGTGTTDSDGTWHPSSTSTIYAGPCRLTPQPSTDRTAVSGEQRVVARLYEVAIDWDAADILTGDDIAITTAVDPHLAGKRLRVTDVRYGSQQWERVLIAEENETALGGT